MCRSPPPPPPPPHWATFSGLAGNLDSRPPLFTNPGSATALYFWSLAYVRFFEALNGAFEVQVFQGCIFTPYQRHWSHVGTCCSDFLKVKTLLNVINDAFNIHWVRHNGCWWHGWYMYIQPCKFLFLIKTWLNCLHVKTCKLIPS